ncbi:Actin-like protein [Hondaea fermentalgiana]|uniref:Actin-like protein n=1 Tax=Hondaea fermentalgiana TaxID=2315210 RepID=A0A2R5G1V3_9STRA|nr:Actin-like protein [Hondaea fermentalgiana]|eukprot:GBG24515.1 Actin-like protein [Hondaea fermentalgiana]
MATAAATGAGGAGGGAGGAAGRAGIDSNQPVVIDNGTGTVKAGFAGGDAPKIVFPSFVGKPKHLRVMLQTKLEGDSFVGKTAEEHRGVLSLEYPMEHGVVRDWDAMEKIWSHVYSSENLDISSEEHPVLLTEAPLNPRTNRERAAEVFFETFGAPALFVSPQATLSLYASGRTTGVVLDSGDGVTHAVPVYEGFTMPHAITRMDVAGRDVTNHLMTLLRKAGYVFHTSAEREVVKAIKEQACYVAFNPTKEERLEQEKHSSKYTFKLPDGTTVDVGPERFRAPEILFNPSLVGLEYAGAHHCIVDAIFKSDLDLRKTLLSQIVLAGGSTMFSGFGDRMLNEVRKATPKAAASGVKIRIAAPPNRDQLTWTGGSILASLATFKSMWVSKQDYEEHGASILHRRSI